MRFRLGAASAILTLLLSLAPAVRAGDGAPPLPVIVPAPDEKSGEDGTPPLPQIIPPKEQEPGLPPLPQIEGAEEEEPAPSPLPEMGPPEAPFAEEPSPGWSERLEEQLGRLPVPLHGFWEARLGHRTVHDRHHSRQFTLGETRLQLESDPFLEPVQFGLKADLLQDFVLRESRINLREANASFSPAEFLDVKLGRQILTWGTGDLIFINDLFPKDYESFFIGRDVEYLKAPSDAIKVSLFSDLANVNVVYSPHFDPDVFVTGKRLSYFNPLAGKRVGEDVRIRTDEPAEWFQDDEVALRLYRNVGSYELAGYAYRGFWKSPAGIDATSGKFTFPRLDVFGASARGPLAMGIGNVEVGYYDSRDDRGGDDPLVRNGEWRFLLGYAQDLPSIASDLSVGVQYYVEHMTDYGAYRHSLPAGSPRADENRHVLTLRLTKLLMNQDLRLELFAFYSPSDDDAYLRPYVSYDITDRWRIDGGANVFVGDEDHTQFAQMKRNNNVYLGLRYSF